MCITYVIVLNYNLVDAIGVGFYMYNWLHFYRVVMELCIQSVSYSCVKYYCVIRIKMIKVCKKVLGVS